MAGERTESSTTITNKVYDDKSLTAQTGADIVSARAAPLLRSPSPPLVSPRTRPIIRPLNLQRSIEALLPIQARLLKHTAELRPGLTRTGALEFDIGTAPLPAVFEDSTGRMSTEVVSCHFRLLDLPYDIRRLVYAIILDGQVVHWCPDEKQTHHFHSPSNPAEKEYSYHVGGVPGDFYDDLSYCSKKHYQSFLGPVRWVSNALPGQGLPSLSEISALLQTCRTVWNEMEPMLWSDVTFSIGLPQFAGFYEKFLAQQRPAHLIHTPRAALLSRIHLAMARSRVLYAAMSEDLGHPPSDCAALVDDAVARSINYLTTACPGLRHLSVTIDGTVMQFPTQELVPLSVHDCLLLIQFRRLASFRIQYSGFVSQWVHGEGVLYRDLNPASPYKHRLDATGRALTDMITDPSGPDAPPLEGLAELVAKLTKVRNERLAELYLRTKRHLDQATVQSSVQKPAFKILLV